MPNSLWSTKVLSFFFVKKTSAAHWQWQSTVGHPPYEAAREQQRSGTLSRVSVSLQNPPTKPNKQTLVELDPPRRLTPFLSLAASRPHPAAAAAASRPAGSRHGIERPRPRAE